MTEFNIYLRDRVHECDIIINSLPYRDGLTVTNRLVIENCVKSCSLYKFVAQKFDADLVTHIDNMLKTCYEKLRMSLEIGVEVSDTNMQALINIAAPIKPETWLRDLCYRITSGVDAAVDIAAEVLKTEFHYSFGNADSSLEINTDLQDSNAEKFVTVERSISILAEAHGLLSYFISGTEGHLELTTNVDSIVKRHRLISEMDYGALSTIDNMTLDELDYVILT